MDELKNNSSYHYIVDVPPEKIEEAVRIWNQEQVEAEQQGMVNIFRHKHGWCGKIGEYAVAVSFPELIPVTQHFNPTKYDYRSDATGYLYEVKTNSADRPFEDGFHFNVNKRQYDLNNNDVYIACYYTPGADRIRVCGWLYKQEVSELGNLIVKGTIIGRKSEEASEDFWKVPYRSIRRTGSLPL